MLRLFFGVLLYLRNKQPYIHTPIWDQQSVENWKSSQTTIHHSLCLCPVRCQIADPPTGHSLLHCLKSQQVLSQFPMMLWALLSSPTNTVSTWDQWSVDNKEADEVGWGQPAFWLKPLYSRPRCSAHRVLHGVQPSCFLHRAHFVHLYGGTWDNLQLQQSSRQAKVLIKEDWQVSCQLGTQWGGEKKLSTRWTNASRTSPSSGQHLEISWLIILRAPLLGCLQASLINVSQILWWDSGLAPWGVGHLLLLLVALLKPPHLRKQFWENHIQREGLDISCWSKTAPQSTLLCLWANVGGCALWGVCLKSRRQNF